MRQQFADPAGRLCRQAARKSFRQERGSSNTRSIPAIFAITTDPFIVVRQTEPLLLTNIGNPN